MMKENFSSFFFKKFRYVLSFLLLFFAMPLSAQNLYINNVSVWHSSDSLHCTDIDHSFTGPAANTVSLPISGVMFGKFLANEKKIEEKKVCSDNGGGCRCVMETVSNSTAVISVPIGRADATLKNTSAISGEGFGTSAPFEGTGELSLGNADSGIYCVEKARLSGQVGSGNTHEFRNFTSIPDDFNTGGDANWYVSNSALYSGNLSGQNNVYSELAIRPYFEYATQVSWGGSVSSENNHDKLFFYVDDDLAYVSNAPNSNIYSITYSTIVLPGVHTLRWVYGKNVSVTSGLDRSTINYITFDMPVYKTFSQTGSYYKKTDIPMSDPNAAVSVINGDDILFQASYQLKTNDDSINKDMICASGKPLCVPGSKRYVFQKEYNSRDSWAYNATLRSWYNSNIFIDRNEVFNNLQDEGIAARGYLSASKSPGDGALYGSTVELDAAHFKPGVKNVSFYGTDPVRESALIEFERPRIQYPAHCLSLCATVQCASSTSPITFGIDEMTFEIFKFKEATNPMQESPIRTISVYNLGNGHRCDFPDEASTTKTQTFGTYCAAWDGFYNLNGDFGKTNSIFGFRAGVKTSQMTSQGTQVDIEQVSSYPGQNQIPIQVDVTDIHNAVSSVTAVGKASVVPAQPYNFKYQLSKDSTVTIKIFSSDEKYDCAANGVVTFSETGANKCLVRKLIESQPKVGEGKGAMPIANGDFWDGRNDKGAMTPAGSYIARIEAASNDEWGTDMAYHATIQMTLDPLIITDIGTRALGAYSTSYATLSYTLTEAATVFIAIFPPGTTFDSTDLAGAISGGFDHYTWRLSGYPGYGPTIFVSQMPIRLFQEEKQARVSVNTIWDGRDSSGNPMCDGNYVYAMYATMPTDAKIGSSPDWNLITTKRLYVGTLPVIRGDVVSTFSPSSTVIGSSPTAAGLEPFYFTYTPQRDTTVTLNIKEMDGTSLVRTVVDREARAARFINKDIWDGTDNKGNFVSSGTYIAELITEDPYTCPNNSVSTRTAVIPVNLFRTVDVKTGSLLSSASSQASITYQFSETMNMDLKIYERGTTLDPSQWPDNVVPSTATVVYTLTGSRPKRMNITEFWDGKDNSGNMKPDGVYPYVLLAYSTARDGVHRSYSTDKTYGYITISRGQILFNKFDVYPTIPTTYNSSEAVHLPPYGIEYSLSRQSTVTVRVVDWNSPSTVYADVVLGENRDANTQYTDYWDGKCTRAVPGKCGRYDFIADGSYKIQVVAEDADQVQALRQPATAYKVIDVAPLRIYDVSIKEVGPDSPGVISYQVSEPMKMVTKIYEPGTEITGFQEPPGLVKRIIGVRSARTPITEIWDGTDLSISPVDDGTYVFSIFGTTVTASISDIDGSLKYAVRKDYDTELYQAPSAYTIPVARGGSIDVCDSFENGSFFAPNPYIGNSGWFKIPVKANGSVFLRIYNIAGDLVFKRDFGKLGQDNNSINGLGKCKGISKNDPACWPKVNMNGSEVARGVYFAVLRFELSDGSKRVCQTVRKILIP